MRKRFSETEHGVNWGPAPQSARFSPRFYFDGALGQDLDHGTALDLDLDAVGDLEAEVLVADGGDLAEHAAGGGDFVALGQGFDHGAGFLLALHLGPDHDEIQHHEHQHQGQHAAERGQHVAAAGCSRRGLGESRGNEQESLQQREEKTRGARVALRGSLGFAAARDAHRKSKRGGAWPRTAPGIVFGTGDRSTRLSGAVGRAFRVFEPGQSLLRFQ
jgi:hypothetical protein